MTDALSHADDPRPAAPPTFGRANNIGVLRLLLASFVIFGHAPEIIDGDRHREPLTQVFHTLSLGEVAVDGFFLISGYLVAMSMARSASLGSYLSRRVLRIVPAYVVAFLLCVLVVAPLVGARVDGPLRTLGRMMLLQEPQKFAGAFPGMALHALNGSMWSISYEFRCYLLVALLGVTGLLLRRRLVLAITVAALAVAVAGTFPLVRDRLDLIDHRLHAEAIIGSFYLTFRMDAIFMVGVCSYVYRDKLMGHLDGRVALLCLVLTIGLMFFDHLAELAVTTLGFYALFWLAFKAKLGAIGRLNADWDISYGVYLYGWPVSMLLLWYDRALGPLALALATLPICLALGAASWWGFERRAAAIGKKAPPRAEPVAVRSAAPVALGVSPPPT